MTRNTLLQVGVTTLAALGLAAAMPANAQTLYVDQVGAGGSTATTSAATAVFIDQFTTTGATTGTQIALPTTENGSNHILTDSGSATSEGAISLSTDGTTLVVVGYDSAPGTASVAATASATTARVVGLINVATGTVDTTTALNAYTGNNIRSATTAGGTSPYIYTTGSGTGILGAADGTVGTPTTISTTSTNTRDTNLFGGNLYFSTGSGTAGIYEISGTPTSAGNTATPVVATGTGSSPYDFVFTNPNTVYVADDRTTAAGGLLQFTNSGSGFALTNTFNLTAASGTGTAGLRSLTFDGSGTIYGISTDNRLVSFSTGTSSFSTLATGTAGGVFRGVEFVPALAAAPEPSGIVALALGAGVLGLMVARRRKVAA